MGMRPTIVIVGDIVLDHHLYEGNRLTPSSDNQRGVHVVIRLGGAAGLAQLLRHFLQVERANLTKWRAHLGTTTPRLHDSLQNNAFALWRPFARHKAQPAGDQVWRAAKLMGYGASPTFRQESATYRPQKRPRTPKPDILVIDDACSQFREPVNRAAWLLPETSEDFSWLLLKMSGKLCEGELWQTCADGFADRLVCLVSVQDLRREYATINAGLSWERTVENLQRALGENKALSQLRRCRHLVITFAADAALWLDQLNGHTTATLVFDSAGYENFWAEQRDGKVIGSLAGPTVALVAALAAQLSAAAPGQPDFGKALEAGLCAMRDLWDLGHGAVTGVAPTGYPVKRSAEVLHSPRSEFARIVLPWDRLADHPSWSITVHSQSPANAAKPSLPIGLARQVVIRGLSAMKGLPVARLGRLATADRQEIESLRNLYNQIEAYARDLSATKPLSIGVFGPPGAGKSFGVKQIATSLLGERSWARVQSVPIRQSQ